VGVNQKGANKKCRHNLKKRQINASKPVKGALNREKKGKARNRNWLKFGKER
jgi:hypothetical protein